MKDDVFAKFVYHVTRANNVYEERLRPVHSFDREFICVINSSGNPWCLQRTKRPQHSGVVGLRRLPIEMCDVGAVVFEVVSEGRQADVDDVKFAS